MGPLCGAHGQTAAPAHSLMLMARNLSSIALCLPPTTPPATNHRLQTTPCPLPRLLASTTTTMALCASKCSTRAAAVSRRSAVVVRANAQSGRRELLGFGAAALLAAVVAAPAKAGVLEDLQAKSAANKALNDKKRLATSSANLARSRTVADGTCSFPQNFFGCESASNRYTGGVKYIADDYALECEGKENTKCASRMQVKF